MASDAMRGGCNGQDCVQKQENLMMTWLGTETPSCLRLGTYPRCGKDNVINAKLLPVSPLAQKSQAHQDERHR